MHAATLSIGDEITLGQILDTNANWLARELAAIAAPVGEHRTVPDDRLEIATAIGELCGRFDLLVITGGLGPTDDDLTREALGDVVDRGADLVRDDDAAAVLARWFAGRKRPMPERNLRQIMRPPSARCIPNPHGTAPGLAATHDGCAIFILPGPPGEMRPMFLDHVRAAVPAGVGRSVLLTAAVHEYGMGESDAADRLGPLMARDREVLVGTTASAGIVTARIRVLGVEDEARSKLLAAQDLIAERWAPYAYGRDGATLAESVGGLLVERGMTLATAESCTGGWLGREIVSVPGSSAWYRGGWITYSNEMKSACLAVPAALIDEHGAVSEPVVRAMTAGAMEAARAETALAVSGIAGPDGGSAGKPVGTVFIGAGIRRDGAARIDVRRFRFRGGRDDVRDRSVKAALQMLRFALLDVPARTPLIWQRNAAPAGVTAAIGLGSNEGDRRATIESAIAALREHPEIDVLAVSSVIETEPVGPVEQPPFLNAAVTVETTLSPRSLLDACLAIESRLGRDRSRSERWGPRTLDLDVLLFGRNAIDETGLHIPHPRLPERRFVLGPLAEIAGNMLHPPSGMSIQSLLAALDRAAIVE